MSPFKPLASLSGGLLVRKGGAMPASLVFPVPEFPVPEPQPAPRVEARVTASHAAAPSPRAETPRPAAQEKPVRAQGGGSPPRRASTAKVSLRLDPDRHQRLRIAALHQRRSGQQLLLAALDAYLDRSALTVLDGACTCLQRRPG